MKLTGAIRSVICRTATLCTAGAALRLILRVRLLASGHAVRMNLWNDIELTRALVEATRRSLVFSGGRRGSSRHPVAGGLLMSRRERISLVSMSEMVNADMRSTGSLWF